MRRLGAHVILAGFALLGASTYTSGQDAPAEVDLGQSLPAIELKAVLNRFCCTNTQVSVRPWIRHDMEAPWKVGITAKVGVTRAESLDAKCGLIANEAKRIFGSGYIFESHLTTPEGKTHDCRVVRLPVGEDE